MRILFKDVHALGDSCEDLIAIKDFHDTNPNVSINFRGFGEELFYNIPWVDRSLNDGNADKVVNISMDLIHRSNQNGMQVVRCIEHDIERNTGLKVNPGDLVLPIEFTNDEKNDCSMFNYVGAPTEGYWIIDAGGKPDFPTKHYPFEYFQNIVDLTRGKIKWVQIGLSEHGHKPLNGVYNMIDMTRSIRDLLKVFWRSSGVLTPISAPLHLSAMPWKDHDRIRPCVVLAGGRESESFTLYPNHHTFTNVGCLDCCRNGGCWKAKVVPSNGQSCTYPVKVGDQYVGKCMEMIRPLDVAKRVLSLAI